MHETAYAKINLALHVRAREPEGYHRIETLFAFAEEGDELSVDESDTLDLRLAGPFAGDVGADADNLVLRAANSLRRVQGIERGASLRLEKRLPVAAGIGGGSADAAAALRLLSRWWGLADDPEQLIRIGCDLGADIPACLASRLVRGDGRGDDLSPVEGEGLEAMPTLLVNPRLRLSTAAVFAAWDECDKGPLGPGTALEMALAGRNDLEPAARELAPVIDQLLAALVGAPDVLLARMSGSGATCFALFRDDEARDRTSRRIAEIHPDWWQLATRLRGRAESDR